MLPSETDDGHGGRATSSTWFIPILGNRGGKSTMAGGDGKHVAVLAFPFGTHGPPLLSLVRKIAAEAPEATFSFFSTSKSNASLFSSLKEEELHNIKAYNVPDGLPEGYVPSGHPLEPIFLFIKAMQQNYRLAMDEAVASTGKKFTCLVTDALYWFGAGFAEEMQVKWIPLWTAGPHSVLIHILTERIREKMGTKDVPGDQSLSFLTGFSELKAADLPEGVVCDIEQPFSTMLQKMGIELPRASAVAINSFAGLHPLIEKELESKFHLVLNIGPFTLTTPQAVNSDEQGCIEWLNKNEKGSVVYISFGSVIMPPPHELAALAEALEECKFPFIWAFRGNPEKQLPNGFLERTRSQGKVVPWAPQMEILKHASVGVFLTHGGWNSVLECTVGGVPMIGRPFFGDQRLNIWMLEKLLGVGARVENGVLAKETILKTLKSTMSGEEGKVMRQKMAELKEIAWKAVEPDGSSTRNLSTLMQIILG